MLNIHKLVENYINYIHSSFDIEEIDKTTYEITTPFLDNSNDHICLYALINGDKVTITDNGDTLRNLTLSGMDFKTQKRRQELGVILNGFNIYQKNNELYVEANASNFAAKQHNILQALISVNDMFVLSSGKVGGFFFDDVAKYLDDIDARYIKSVSLEGKSHLSHKFDFIISKSKNQKERLIKTLNTPKSDNFKASLFSFSDLLDDRKQTTDSIIILNDEKAISDGIINAAEEYKIKAILWSEIYMHKKYLAA